MSPASAHHQRQVSAGRAAADADAIGIDVEVGRVGANVAHRQVHVGDRFGNRVLRLAAVHDREDRVAPREQLLEKAEIDVVVIRHPAAADDPDHGRAVGVALGREHVHGQRRAKLAAIDHVLAPRVGRFVVGKRGRGEA